MFHSQDQEQLLGSDQGLKNGNTKLKLDNCFLVALIQIRTEELSGEVGDTPRCLKLRKGWFKNQLTSMNRPVSVSISLLILIETGSGLNLA